MEFKSLKDTMASQKSEISEELEHLKSVITEQKEEIINEINVKIQVVEENKELKWENNKLKDRVRLNQPN